MEANHLEFDVAFSLAGEDIEIVREIADSVQKQGVRVFFYEFEKYDLWGKNLYEYLNEVYFTKARYCVMFISEHYARKHWTKHERQAAQARSLISIQEYLLPVRLDNTDVQALLPTVSFLDFKAEGVDGIVSAIYAKCKGNGVSKKFDTTNALSTSSTSVNDIPQPKNSIVTLTLRTPFASFDRTKTENLMEFIAEIVQIGVENIELVDISEGSVKITLKMPEAAALKLHDLLKQSPNLLAKFSLSAFDMKSGVIKRELKIYAKDQEVNESQTRSSQVPQSPTLSQSRIRAKKLYVGNLPYSITDSELRDLFEAAGEVAGVTIIMDRETGRSRGFGFVEMATDESAQEAIRKYNGFQMGNRPLTVNEALPQTSNSRFERRRSD